MRTLGWAELWRVAHAFGDFARKRVPRPSRSVRRAGTTDACSDGLMLPDGKHMAQAAWCPPLQSTQGRGTHNSETGRKNTERVGHPPVRIRRPMLSNLSRKKRIWVAVTSITLLQMDVAGCTGSRSVSAQVEGHQPMNPPEASITASIAGDDIVVTVVLADRATEAFPLLRWNLPADGRLTGSLFEVNRNGKSQQYLGEMVKRRVTADDYLSLQPAKNTKQPLA